MRLEALQSELKKVEQRRLKLEQQIKKQQDELFTSLPKKVGLRSVDALVQALIPYTSPSLRQKLMNGESKVTAGSRAPATKPAPKAAARAAAASIPTAPSALLTPKPVTFVKVPAKRGRPSAASQSSGGRVRYPEALKAEVRKALMKGEKNSVVAAKHGLGLDTIKKWKRKWGLTSAAKSKPAKAK